MDLFSIFDARAHFVILLRYYNNGTNLCNQNCCWNHHVLHFKLPEKNYD